MITGKVLKGNNGSVNCLTVWYGYLYSGSGDGTIRVWREFYLTDFNKLDADQKRLVMTAALIFKRLKVNKSIWLPIFRALI